MAFERNQPRLSRKPGNSPVSHATEEKTVENGVDVKELRALFWQGER